MGITETRTITEITETTVETIEITTEAMHKSDKMAATATNRGDKHFKIKCTTGMGHPRMNNTSNPEKTSSTQYQAHHQSLTNTGTSIGLQVGSHNPSSTSRDNNKQKDKIILTAETLNCHGFAQSSDYIISRLNTCDILCLTETWIWPHEVNLISETIHNHPKIQKSSQEYTVISKCGMHDREPDYSGLGYGGVSDCKEQCKFLHKRNHLCIRSSSSNGHV